MRRYQDWVPRLDAYITANRDRPFSYDPALGLDCCRFTWGAIEAMTGIPIGRQFAGTYHTMRESLLVMKAYCGRPSLRMSIQKLMLEYGFERTTYAYARRGDAVLAPQSRAGDFLGVVALNGREVLSIGNGIRAVPMSPACMAWRID